MFHYWHVLAAKDSHVRPTQPDVEYEIDTKDGSDEKNAVDIDLVTRTTLGYLQQWCAADFQVLEECLKLLMDSTLQALGSDVRMENRKVPGRNTYQCIQYDVGSQEVSIRHPMIRMLATLLVSGLQRGQLKYRLRPSRALWIAHFFIDGYHEKLKI